VNSDLDFPIALLNSDDTKYDSDQQDESARDSVDPHVHSPVDFHIAVGHELDKSEDTPGCPHHETMEEEKVKALLLCLRLYYGSIIVDLDRKEASVVFMIVKAHRLTIIDEGIVHVYL
jgi:hypothetical protein